MRTSFNSSVLAIMEEIKQQATVSEAMPQPARPQQGRHTHNQQQNSGQQMNVQQAAQNAGDAAVDAAMAVQQQSQQNDPNTPDQQTLAKQQRQPQKPQKTMQQQANKQKIMQQLAQQNDQNRDGQLDSMESEQANLDGLASFIGESTEGGKTRAQEILTAIVEGLDDGVFSAKAAKHLLMRRIHPSIHEHAETIVNYLSTKIVTEGIKVLIGESGDGPVIGGQDNDGEFENPDEQEDPENPTVKKAKEHAKKLNAEAPKAPGASRHGTDIEGGDHDQHEEIKKSVLCQEGVLSGEERESLIDSIFKD